MKKLLLFSLMVLLGLSSCSKEDLSVKMNSNNANDYTSCTFYTNLPGVTGLIKGDVVQYAKAAEAFRIKVVTSEPNVQFEKFNPVYFRPLRDLYFDYDIENAENGWAAYKAELTKENIGHGDYSIEVQFKKTGKLLRTATTLAAVNGQAFVTGGGTYDYDEYFTIEAVATNPKAYEFDYWSKDGENIGGSPKMDTRIGSYEIGGANPDVHYRAHYKQKPKSRVVFEWTEGGHATGWEDLGLNVFVDSPFTVTAIPYEGYEFVAWIKSTYPNTIDTVSKDRVYSATVPRVSDVTYTAIFKSMSQATSVTFNNFVDDSYYASNTYLTYTDPNGQQQTLYPTSITSYFDIKRDTPVRLYVDIRKDEEYIPCFVEGSDGQRLELSADNQVLVIQDITVQPELDNTAVITLQAGS